MDVSTDGGNKPEPERGFCYDKVGNRKTRQGIQAPWTYNKNKELVTSEVATVAGASERWAPSIIGNVERHAQDQVQKKIEKSRKH